jgi:hypothetical protein
MSLSEYTLKATAGLIEVSQAEFFAVINPLDVHPRVDIASFKQPETISAWEIQHSRERIGVTASKAGLGEPRWYFLVPSRAPRPGG